MHGVLIVEALAQVGAVAVLKKEENRGRLAFFAGIDNCRFKTSTTGDQLRLEVEMTRVRGPIGKGKAIATVDGEVACEAEITFAIGDKRIDSTKNLLVKRQGIFYCYITMKR